MLEVIAGGLLGALLATMISILFQFWFQRIRLKAEVMLAVNSWANEVYQRTIDLAMQKKVIYEGGDPWLSEEDYQECNRELRKKLLFSDVQARVALVYGEGDELGLLQEFKKQLLEASRRIWNARKETWDQVSKDTHEAFQQKVDPLRIKVERMLLSKATLPKWLLKMGS